MTNQRDPMHPAGSKRGPVRIRPGRDECVCCKFGSLDGEICSVCVVVARAMQQLVADQVEFFARWMRELEDMSARFTRVVDSLSEKHHGWHREAEATFLRAVVTLDPGALGHDDGGNT